MASTFAKVPVDEMGLAGWKYSGDGARKWPLEKHRATWRGCSDEIDRQNPLQETRSPHENSDRSFISRAIFRCIRLNAPAPAP